MKILNISIFGNTNNVSFALAIGFIKLGISVRLVINRREKLHRPESRLPEYSNGYPPWILDASDITDEEFVFGSSRVGDVINFLTLKADAIVFNHIGPSLAAYCQKPHISLLTGSDVTYYANFKSIDVQAENYDFLYKISKGCEFVKRQWQNFIVRQRAGIASSIFIHVAPVGLVSEIDKIMCDIGINEKNRIGNYMTHALDFSSASVPTSDSNKGRFRILNGARLNWKKPFPGGFCTQDDKGTDILIRGFNDFISLGYDAELVMIKKGLHISETKNLVNELGLEDRIIWLDELNMQDFLEEMLLSDVVCDQFGTTTPGLVALDSMALKIPVVANFNLQVLQKIYPSLDFVCDAQTSEQITKQFIKIYSCPEFRLKLIEASYSFVSHFCSPESVARVYLDKLGAASNLRLGV